MTLLSKSLFKKIHKLYGPPPTWSRPEGFVSLSMFILEQQVSLASAKAHFEKLNSYVKKFSPKGILKLSDQEMRACQISRQKTKYLRALSEAVLKKEIVLEKLRELPEEEARAQLIKIKGIGNWTADVYLMFALQSKDIFPIGDIALVNTVRELTKADTKEEIIELAETWRPNRTLASFYLWHYYLSKRGRS